MSIHHHPHVKQAEFTLSTSQLTAQAIKQFQTKTGLADLYWQVLYDISDSHQQTVEQSIQQAKGYVFFLHGWDGSHLIWEDLPLRLILSLKEIVCFIPDVNGFGRTPFIEDTPDEVHCCPTGMMIAIEEWLSLIGLQPNADKQDNPFYLFVGHSMGGAALFYKQEQGWQNQSYSLYTLAPALLCNDVQYQRFYKTLGLGIGIPSFSFLKKQLAPRVIEILGGGASQAVKDEHVRIFSTTPFGTLAKTIYAMGALATKPQRTDWSRFQIALGNKDRLVALNSMLDLLEEFDIKADQLRVMFGDHYFFSHDQQSPHSHRHNREVILQDLIKCCDTLKQGKY